MNSYLRRLCLAVTISATLWTSVQAIGQTKSVSKSSTQANTQVSNTTPQGKRWIKDPNAVMPMRKMTKLERRKAATRNAARRSAAHRKPGVVPANQGVQQ